MPIVSPRRIRIPSEGEIELLSKLEVGILERNKFIFLAARFYAGDAENDLLSDLKDLLKNEYYRGGRLPRGVRDLLNILEKRA